MFQFLSIYIKLQMEKKKIQGKQEIKDYSMTDIIESLRTPSNLKELRNQDIESPPRGRMKSQKRSQKKFGDLKLSKQISINFDNLQPYGFEPSPLESSASMIKTAPRTKQKLKQRIKNRSLKPRFEKDPKQNDPQIKFQDQKQQIEYQKQNYKNTKKKPIQQNKLKLMINNYRMEKLKQHFYSQLRKNSVFRSPIDYQPFQSNRKSISSQEFEGIFIPKILLNFANLISISHTILACFFTTLLIVFSQLSYHDFTKYFQILTIAILACELLVGFVRVRSVGAKNLIKIKDICRNYLHYNFWIDLLCLFSSVLCYLSKEPLINYSFGVFFLRVPDCIEKLDKIQTKIFDSFYWEQYWGLMKVLLTNFGYSHFIAILLLMMSWLDQNQSWLTIKNIQNSLWYEKYCWAYYWGTTIMMTVGFGDISAANYKEAICLVLIQTLSCLALAYNINQIGVLIRNLRCKQMQKQKSLKVLRKLCNKNQLNSDLNLKLTTHINQTYNIQTKYSFQQEEQFIQKLPINIKQQFLRTTNYKTIQKLTFIKNFTHRTLLQLAQKLQVKIYHPDQIIYQNIRFINKVVILKQGEVGIFPNFQKNKLNELQNNKNPSKKKIITYTYKTTNKKNNKTVIDKIIVKQGQNANLLSLDFLSHAHKHSHNNVKNYEYISMSYSKMYEITINQLLNILKKKDVDIQFYFTMRDKYKCNMDQFQLIVCPNCNQSTKQKIKLNKKIKQDTDELPIIPKSIIHHTKFKCPRLHYCPISQQIIHRYIHGVKIEKNQRKQSIRQKQLYNCLFLYKKYKDAIKANNNQSLNTQMFQNNNEYSQCQCQQCIRQCKAQIVKDIKGSANCIKQQSLSLINQFLNYSAQQRRKKAKRTILTMANNLNMLSKNHCSMNYHSVKQLKTKLLMNVSQLMQKQMSLLLKQNSLKEQSFWDLEIDEAKDYKFYFPHGNPKNFQAGVRLKKNTNYGSIMGNFNNNMSLCKSIKNLNKSIHNKKASFD